MGLAELVRLHVSEDKLLELLDKHQEHSEGDARNTEVHEDIVSSSEGHIERIEEATNQCQKYLSSNSEVHGCIIESVLEDRQFSSFAGEGVHDLDEDDCVEEPALTVLDGFSREADWLVGEGTDLIDPALGPVKDLGVDSLIADNLAAESRHSEVERGVFCIEPVNSPAGVGITAGGTKFGVSEGEVSRVVCVLGLVLVDLDGGFTINISWLESEIVDDYVVSKEGSPILDPACVAVALLHQPQRDKMVVFVSGSACHEIQLAFFVGVGDSREHISSDFDVQDDNSGDWKRVLQNNEPDERKDFGGF